MLSFPLHIVFLGFVSHCPRKPCQVGGGVSYQRFHQQTLPLCRPEFFPPKFKLEIARDCFVGQLLQGRLTEGEGSVQLTSSLMSLFCKKENNISI